MQLQNRAEYDPVQFQIARIFSGRTEEINKRKSEFLPDIREKEASKATTWPSCYPDTIGIPLPTCPYPFMEGSPGNSEDLGSTVAGGRKDLLYRSH